MSQEDKTQEGYPDRKGAKSSSRVWIEEIEQKEIVGDATIRGIVVEVNPEYALVDDGSGAIIVPLPEELRGKPKDGLLDLLIAQPVEISGKVGRIENPIEIFNTHHHITLTPESFSVIEIDIEAEAKKLLEDLEEKR